MQPSAAGQLDSDVTGMRQACATKNFHALNTDVVEEGVVEHVAIVDAPPVVTGEILPDVMSGQFDESAVADATLLSLTPPVADRTSGLDRRHWLLHVGGLVYEIPGDDVIIGRRPGIDHELIDDDTVTLRIEDPTRSISKVHARLRRTAKGWTVEDLHSANGVRVIHTAGGERRIRPGDIVPATEAMMFGSTPVKLATK
jgi:hypothetical protein